MKKILLITALLLMAGPAFSQAPAEDVDALVEQGFSLLRENKMPEAEAKFQRAVDFTPCNVDAAYGLSLIYKRTGKWAEAQSVLEKTEANCKDNANALHYLRDF